MTPKNFPLQLKKFLLFGKKIPTFFPTFCQNFLLFWPLLPLDTLNSPSHWERLFCKAKSYRYWSLYRLSKSESKSQGSWNRNRRGWSISSKFSLWTNSKHDKFAHWGRWRWTRWTSNTVYFYRRKLHHSTCDKNKLEEIQELLKQALWDCDFWNDSCSKIGKLLVLVSASQGTTKHVDVFLSCTQA